MTELGLLEGWSNDALTVSIIIGLIILNIIFLCFAITHKRRQLKLERYFLAAEQICKKSPLSVKRPFAEPAPIKASEGVNLSDNGYPLKIDQAINMLTNGASLEEVKLALEIEASYLRIIAAHHQK